MKNLDKFYTKAAVARVCLNTMLNNVPVDGKTFLEPSAGAGAFYDLIDYPKIGLDIKPEHPAILEQDFLSFTSNKIDYICLGNPPFGKNSSLALKFINHAVKFSSHIGFILPRTFQKKTFCNKIDTRLWLIHEEILPLNSFEFNLQTVEVPTVFQIWERRKSLRPTYKPKTNHNDFEFVDKDHAMFAIQRVGGAAGKIKLDYKSFSSSSHLYVRSNSLSKEQLYERFIQLNFESEKYKTAGNPSISKSDVIELYAKLFGDSK